METTTRFVATFDAMAIRHDQAAHWYEEEIRRERMARKENPIARFRKMVLWTRAVDRFADAMLGKLHRVRHKRHWNETTLSYRMHRVREEMLEVHEAYEALQEAMLRGDSLDRTAARRKLMDELVDLGNTAMIAREFFVEGNRV